MFIRRAIFIIAIVMHLPARADDATLIQIAASLENAASRLPRFKVSSDTFYEKYVDEKRSWQPTGDQISITAWCGEAGSQKMRVDVENEILHWNAGTSPYIFSQYDYSFDGRFGRIVQHATGGNNLPARPASPMKLKKAEILAEPPSLFQQPYIRQITLVDYLGARIQKMTPDGPMPFSQVVRQLAALKETNNGITVVSDDFEGNKCVKVQVEIPDALQDTYWFDAEHDYVPRGYVHKQWNRGMSGWSPGESWRVTSLSAGGEGIWYPTQVEYVYPDQKQRALIKLTSFSTDIAAGDEVFRAPIPPGYSVTDTAAGLTYKVGQDPATHQSSLDSMVDEIRRMAVAQTRPVSDYQHPNNSDIQTVQPTEIAESLPRVRQWRWVLLFIFAGAIVVGIVIFTTIARRWRRVAGVVVLFSMLVPQRAIAQESRPVSTTQPHFIAYDGYVEHCGLDVTYLALTWFGKRITINQLASELGLKQPYAFSTDLLTIKRAMSSYKLQIVGYKADTLKEILAYVKAEKIVLLSISPRAPQSSIGHFVLLFDAGKHVVVADAPFPPRYISRDEVDRDPQLSQFSGGFLSIEMHTPTSGAVSDLRTNHAFNSKATRP